jgi:anti-sigma factor RsiW
VTPDTIRPPEEDLACQEVVEIVSDYLDGSMTGGVRRRFEAHLQRCPYCTDYVEQLREVGVALRGLAAESIESARRDALLEAFRGWHEH